MIEIDDAGEGEFRIHGNATVYEVEDLHKKLIVSIRHRSGPLTISLEGLSALDLAGAQVLLALRRTVGPERLRYREIPETIRTMLERSGLLDALS